MYSSTATIKLFRLDAFDTAVSFQVEKSYTLDESSACKVSACISSFRRIRLSKQRMILQFVSPCTLIRVADSNFSTTDPNRAFHYLNKRKTISPSNI